MKTSFALKLDKLLLILIALWALYTSSYIYIQYFTPYGWLTGYSTLFLECALDITCFCYAFKLSALCDKKLKTFFILLGLSFAFCLFADIAYNISAYIHGEVQPTLKSLSYIEVPFSGFLLLQLINWVTLTKQAKINTSRFNIAYFPFLIALITLMISIYYAINWQFHASPALAFFDIILSTLEISSFPFVMICLFLSKDKLTTNACTGYLLIIIADLFFRSFEVNQALHSGNIFEAMWILGLIFIIRGLHHGIKERKLSIDHLFCKWNSLKVQISYWLLFVFLFTFSVILLASLPFVKLNLPFIVNLPEIIMIFSIISAYVSKGVTRFTIAEFNHLKHLVAYYSGDRNDKGIEETTLYPIDEFNQLEEYLKDGLNAIKQQRTNKKAFSDLVISYADDIRNPVIAIKMLANDAEELNPEIKSKFTFAANEILSISNSLLNEGNITPSPEKVNKKNSDVTLIKEFGVVLVDDSFPLRMAWEMVALEEGVKLTVYDQSKSFKENLSIHSENTTIFIDINLNDKIDGIALAKHAFEQGYKNIYLITGDKTRFDEKYDWVKAIIDKQPPF